jgi:hypothetical protein
MLVRSRNRELHLLLSLFYECLCSFLGSWEQPRAEEADLGSADTLTTGLHISMNQDVDATRNGAWLHREAKRT